MTTPNGLSRPTQPRLAKVFDQAMREGLEVRFADDTQVIVYRRNHWGCGGLIVLLLLGLLTAFIVPLILLILGALSPTGQIITYTIKPNGKLKKKQRAARN